MTGRFTPYMNSTRADDRVMLFDSRVTLHVQVKNILDYTVEKRKRENWDTDAQQYDDVCFFPLIILTLTYV